MGFNSGLKGLSVDTLHKGDTEENNNSRQVRSKIDATVK
jgi:hypothetical protein